MAWRAAAVYAAALTGTAILVLIALAVVGDVFPARAVHVATGAAMLAAAVVAAWPGGSRWLPQLGWEVPRAWAQFGARWYAAFGVAFGAFVVTSVTGAGVVAVPLWALGVGSVRSVAVVGLLYAIARAVPAMCGASRVDRERGDFVIPFSVLAVIAYPVDLLLTAYLAASLIAHAV
jgi:hypothetical protein